MPRRHRSKLSEYAQRWRVMLDADIIETPHGILGFGTRDGDPVVLKIPHQGTGEELAALALQHFGSEAAVRLIECADDGTALLERAMPGTHLTDLVLDGLDDHATEALCKIAAAIHKPPPRDAKFPLVADWGNDFSRYEASGDQLIAPSLVRQAHEMFDSLIRSQGSTVLLHGDLHHDNVVWDSRRGWLAIDPKGVVGEPAYEVGAALRNPTDDPHWFAPRSIVTRRVSLFCDRLALDPDRVIAWAYAQAVLSAIWSVQDGDDPKPVLALATTLESMLR